MALEDEIASASKKVVKDGYDMSLGELMSLYRERELIVNPKYQRYFRWDISQKTKFVESLLLGIPIPPIFVYTTTGRKWELVDGLQRMSTIFEFSGILRDPTDPQEKKLVPPSVLEGTTLLPSLVNKRWEPTSESEDDQADAFTEGQRIDIKRVRIRVEILKKESDPLAKYELFQRLNTGGSALSEQEVRSCVIIMINEKFHEWLQKLEAYEPFVEAVDLTERAEKRQKSLEYVIRFLAFRNHPYQSYLDVHEYLDNASIAMASNNAFNAKAEEDVFKKTFTLIKQALGPDAFKKWDGNKFIGQSSLAAYEVIAHGVSRHVAAILQLKSKAASFVSARAKELWSDQTFRDNSGSGVRGTTRLPHLLPLAENFFQP
jgi:hypothetical protein